MSKALLPQRGKHMSTTALRPFNGLQPRPRGDANGPRGSLRPAHVASIVVGACAVAFFSIAAPLIGNPARRLLWLDNTANVDDEFVAPSEHGAELSPGNGWVAVDTVDWIDTSALMMPPLDVRAEPPTATNTP
jgi:hypothetical protein